MERWMHWHIFGANMYDGEPDWNWVPTESCPGLETYQNGAIRLILHYNNGPSDDQETADARQLNDSVSRQFHIEVTELMTPLTSMQCINDLVVDPQHPTIVALLWPLRLGVQFSFEHEKFLLTQSNVASCCKEWQKQHSARNAWMRTFIANTCITTAMTLYERFMSTYNYGPADMHRMAVWTQFQLGATRMAIKAAMRQQVSVD